MCTTVGYIFLGMERSANPPSGEPKDFNWLDGTSVGDTFYSFNPGEPNLGPSGNENCVLLPTIILGYHLWYTNQCHLKTPSACQREAGTTRM